MPDDARWRALLAEAVARRPQPVRAETFHRKFHTFSQPVLLECSDGNAYVVKGRQQGRQIGRAICNDQIIARLGRAMGASVGVPQLVEIPTELIATEPQLAHLESGIAHGCLWVPGCTERAWLEYAHVAENRPRFLSLAILYGWVSASDHQVIYENEPPHLVHSVDHGHFFPGGPDWTTASLAGATVARPDQRIVQQCALAHEELRRAADALRGIGEEEIAHAVAMPPSEWGLSDGERLELVKYLWRRREDLLAYLDGTP